MTKRPEVKKPRRPKHSATRPRAAGQTHRQRIAALCAWFEAHARDLPWRRPEVRDGYTALVAEAMLQQTQVSRVAPSFEAFIRKFPNVRALAAASEQQVLAMWRGLGYYRRAWNLHRAAQMIVAEFGGTVPSTADELRRLPGVGQYTAGAVASIAFGRAEPIVDGNVRRVLARWAARCEPDDANGTLEWAWRTARELVELADRPGVLNEAIMELGAVICTPKSPRCDACPVAKFCCAKQRGIQHEIPLPLKRAKPRSAHHHAVIISRGGKILLEQRNGAGMWSGMWQTPTIESDRPLDLIELKHALPVAVQALTKRGQFVHSTTHRRIVFHVYDAASKARRGTWRELSDLDDLPMSNAQRRVLAMAQSDKLD